MDGRTSKGFRRHVLEPIYTRFFAEEYREELLELLRKEEEAVTVTRRSGKRAKLGGANASGSAITTDLNTCDAAFNEYCARREAGETPADAYAHLGAYFGDDSVVAEPIFDGVVAVARELGMVLEKEPAPEDAGPGYVVFLSRVYPDVRTSLASHPVVVRSLRKLCTITAGPNVPVKVVAQKLALKVGAVLVTDSHVPVVSAYARAVQRVYNLCSSGTELEKLGRLDPDYNRKVNLGPYPFDQGDEAVLAPSVAQGLGITLEEMSLLEQRLAAAETREDLTRASLLREDDGLPDWARWIPIEGAAL